MEIQAVRLVVPDVFIYHTKQFNIRYNSQETYKLKLMQCPAFRSGRKEKICDEYCKYPGKVEREEDLWKDNSPCMECPLTGI